jgi:hypothetical protein
VFSDNEWTPPRDWGRTSGLVEDIRKAYTEIEEQLRLEAESRGVIQVERMPSEPIELPGEVRAEGVAPQDAPAAGAARRGRRAAPAQAPATPARPPAGGQTPPAPAPAAPAPAPRPAAPAPAQPRGELESPVRLNPLARSVNVERME